LTRFVNEAADAKPDEKPDVIADHDVATSGSRRRRCTAARLARPSATGAIVDGSGAGLTTMADFEIAPPAVAGIARHCLAR